MAESNGKANGATAGIINIGNTAYTVIDHEYDVVRSEEHTSEL